MTSFSGGVLPNTLSPLRPTAPSTIGNWNLLGCANSPSGFLGWFQVASIRIITDEYCAIYRHARINGANCTLLPSLKISALRLSQIAALFRA